MTTWELIRTMAQKGYEFQMGHHTEKLRGYWACFIKIDDPDTRERCDECEEPVPAYWAECGHAMTAYRAVIMAAKIVLKKPVTVPPDNEFKL